jgi:two-component system, OmpR family, response regulator
MMLQSDDINGAPAMDFDAWRALLRSNCGRDVEVTAPNACKRFGYSPGARAGEGAVRARTAESALSARDVQFGRPRYNRHGRGPVRAAGLEDKVSPVEIRIAAGQFSDKKLRDQFMLADAGHIVVVDDDSSLRQMVIRYLEDHNIPTRPASNRTELNRHLTGTIPSLIILDLRLGQEDGLDMLREIRAHSDVPVIITTGHRPDEIDRIVGLELGADDYIVKPFSLRELLARVRAVLRRQEMGRFVRAHDPERGGYRFDGWQLERRNRRLLDPSGTPVALSKGEYGLLLAFLEAPQRPLSRENLLQATRIHEDIFDRSIDVQVLRLRRKLEVNPSAPRVIQTERGVGYIFVLTVEPF